MKVTSHTKRGRKPVNEDYLLYEDFGDGRHLLLIADGIGGYSNGNIAARIVAETIWALFCSQKNITGDLIQVALNKGNLALRQFNGKSNVKSGATVGGVYISNDTINCFWVGDVSIVHMRNGKILFESKPHSLVQEMCDKGIIIDPDMAKYYRHIVTRAIQGDFINPKGDFYFSNINLRYDRLIISSDGFSFHDFVASYGLEFREKDLESYFNNCQPLDDSSMIYIDYR